jgi:hypothetical protein
VIFPGIVVSIAVFDVNPLGDALGDIVDPKLNGKRATGLPGTRTRHQEDLAAHQIGHISCHEMAYDRLCVIPGLDNHGQI